MPVHLSLSLNQVLDINNIKFITDIKKNCHGNSLHAVINILYMDVLGLPVPMNPSVMVSTNSSVSLMWNAPSPSSAAESIEKYLVSSYIYIHIASIFY